MTRLFIILLMFFWSASVQAAIEEIEVLAEVNGSSPLDAQQKAVDYAKKRAFYILLSQLAPDRAHKIATSLTPQQIDSHIRGYELLNERANGNHYLAQYKVSVSEDLVQRLLSGPQNAVRDVPNPVLILPVLRDGDQQLLWDGGNVWRSIMNSTALELGESLLVMPYGDPKDTLLTDATSVMTYHFDDFAPLIERYGANEVVVALATYERERMPEGVTIHLRRLSPGLDKQKSIYFETDSHNETPESLLPMVARQVVDQLKEIARASQLAEAKRIADANKLPLEAHFRRLSDWVRMQEKLRNLPKVIKMEVNAINVTSADATLYYTGSPELMQQMMEANGLSVVNTRNRWAVAMH